MNSMKTAMMITALCAAVVCALPADQLVEETAVTESTSAVADETTDAMLIVKRYARKYARKYAKKYTKPKAKKYKAKKYAKPSKGKAGAKTTGKCHYKEVLAYQAKADVKNKFDKDEYLDKFCKSVKSAGVSYPNLVKECTKAAKSKLSAQIKKGSFKPTRGTDCKTEQDNVNKSYALQGSVDSYSAAARMCRCTGSRCSPKKHVVKSQCDIATKGCDPKKVKAFHKKASSKKSIDERKYLVEFCKGPAAGDFGQMQRACLKADKEKKSYQKKFRSFTPTYGRGCKTQQDNISKDSALSIGMGSRGRVAGRDFCQCNNGRCRPSMGFVRKQCRAHAGLKRGYYFKRRNAGRRSGRRPRRL